MDQKLHFPIRINTLFPRRRIAIGLIILWTLNLIGCGLLNDQSDEEVRNRIELRGKIVFSMRAEERNAQIFTINTDGSDLTQLTFWDTRHTGFDQYPNGFMGLLPTFSPDGEKILLNTPHSVAIDMLLIWLINTDESDSRSVYISDSGLPLVGEHPRWSPDGTKITFFRLVEPGLAPIVFDTITKETFYLGTELYDSEQNTFPRMHYPEWSPDGNRIAFVSNLDTYLSKTETGWDFFVIDAEGTNLQKVTNKGFEGANIPYPLWHSDNQSLIFRSTESVPGLYQVDIPSGNIEMIISDSEVALQLFPHAVSGDGNYLLVSTTPIETSGTKSLSILDVNEKYLVEVYAIESPNKFSGADLLVEKEFDQPF